MRTALNGIAGMTFIGDGVRGRLNMAAFLAQSMKETIAYDVCDENNWDAVGGAYPASNSCGQLGQQYSNYKCSAAEKMMECPIDATMEKKAATNAQWVSCSVLHLRRRYNLVLICTNHQLTRPPSHNSTGRLDHYSGKSRNMR